MKKHTRKLQKKPRCTVASLRQALQFMTLKATTNATEAGRLLAELTAAHSELAAARSQLSSLRSNIVKSKAKLGDKTKLVRRRYFKKLRRDLKKLIDSIDAVVKRSGKGDR